MENETVIYVTSDQVGSRCDVFLSVTANITRTKAQAVIDGGSVMVNGKVAKNNLKLAFGDRVSYTLPPPEAMDVIPQDIPIDIVYEDEALAVVNKPKGMVVHPAAGNPDGTMVNALLYRFSSLSNVGGAIRPGVVHRIDKDTSGLLIVAKNDASHLYLSSQIAEHSFDREYRAVIIGTPDNLSGSIDAPIGRSLKDRKKMAVTDKNSKRAVTHYEVIRSFGSYSYVKFKLETGRTHQIRVHCAYIGHPVLGDPVYGGIRKEFSELNGQCLHAKCIGFNHPISNERMFFESELPEYFRKVLEKLESKHGQLFMEA